MGCRAIKVHYCFFIAVGNLFISVPRVHGFLAFFSTACKKKSSKTGAPNED